MGASGHILLIEFFQSQSLNACKRVGVSGHVPELLGTCQPGEERESRKGKPQERNWYGWDMSHRGKKEREIGAGATMEGEFWSVTRANWTWITEEPGCQAERVNSYVNCTKTTSVDVGLLVFLVESSLEFPTEIFLVTCARETPINEWHIPWDIHDKQMVIPWVNPDKQMVHPLG
jgi:hypothetical protein